MNLKVVTVLAHWRDKMIPFEAKCLVMPAGLSDFQRYHILKHHPGALYVFEEGDQIVGEHGIFIVRRLLSEQSFHEEVLQ